MNHEKLYKEALERAKNYSEGHTLDVNPRTAMEYVFPELKESEDEITIKEAITIVQSYMNICDKEGDPCPTGHKVISWLEKQEHDGKKWIYEDVYLKEKEQVFQDGVTEVLENPQRYGLEEKPKHFELKAGHWYICHRAFCCRADHLTVQEGERFMCEKDGVVKGFVFKNPEKYFVEVYVPAPFEDEQKSAWSEEDETFTRDAVAAAEKYYTKGCGQEELVVWLKSLKDRVQLQPNQGEQKSINKIEPKFKVGDLITNGILVGEIDEIHELGYHAYFGDLYADVPDAENWHKWTIQDAKDGDVLAVDWHEGDDFWEKIIIFKKYHNKGVEGILNSPCVEGYGNTFKNGKLAFSEEVPYYSKTWTANLHPATKDQRDFLFQKIKEEGYEWDAEKKELRKIDARENLTLDGDLMQADCMMIEQKPAWSEKNLKEFNVEEYYKNPERKVVTRDGREVEILKIDTKTKTDVPVIAMMDGNDIRFYTTNGRLSLERETCSDLFFADDNCTNEDNTVKVEIL